MMKEILDAAFKRAEENGDFDDLPGAGKPIKKSSLTTDPFAHVYSESGAMTPVQSMQGKIDAARKRLRETDDPAERRVIETELAMLETRKAIEMETFKRYT